MPYLQLDLPDRYPAEAKRAAASRLCRLYSEVMQTQSWRPNVGIRELGPDSLFREGRDGVEPIAMVLVEIRRGRSVDDRLRLAHGIVDICVDVFALPRERVMIEFTLHDGDEIYREGKWVGDWTPAESEGGREAP